MRSTIPNLWRPAAAVGVAWLLLWAPPTAAQGGPIWLFPDLGTETPPMQPGAPAQPNAPAQPAAPATSQPERQLDAPRGFRVEGLPAPEIDAIGLAGPAEGGFDQSLWAGSDGELILELLRDLPVATENPPLRALTRRLLMTGAPVQSLHEPGSVLAARAGRLLAMGDLDGASALLERVPPTESDSAIARLVVQAALLRGDQDIACRRAADIAPTSDAAFWAEVTVYCRLVDGDVEGARLGLALLRDQEQADDAAFFALVESIAAGEPTAAPLPDEPSALQVALYRLAGLPLPPSTLASASPELLAAAARDPRLVADDRLALAEHAFLFGALPPDALAARYREEPHDGSADVPRQVATAWDPATRVLAHNVLPDQPATERGQLLDALWRRAQGSERFLVADMFAAPFAGLPAERGRLRLAPSFARALLAAERPVPAAGWFSLLSADAASDPRAREDLAGLTPLFAMAGTGGTAAVPELDDQAMTGWLAATPDGEVKAAHLLALLEGNAVPVSEAAWHRLIASPSQEPTLAPPAALWRSLEHAADDRRVGETVLLALHLLGGRPETAHPEALAAALRALHTVGLNQEARAIAIATALTMGL